VVTRREGMARIEAHTDALPVIDELEHGTKLLEAPAQAGALAGGVLEQQQRGARLPDRQDAVYRLGDRIDATFDTGAEMSPWMYDQAAKTQRVAAVKLVCQAHHRGSQGFLLGRRQVDQVGGVRRDGHTTGSVLRSERVGVLG